MVVMNARRYKALRYKHPLLYPEIFIFIQFALNRGCAKKSKGGRFCINENIRPFEMLHPIFEKVTSDIRNCYIRTLKTLFRNFENVKTEL